MQPSMVKIGVSMRAKARFQRRVFGIICLSRPGLSLKEILGRVWTTNGLDDVLDAITVLAGAGLIRCDRNLRWHRA